MLNGGNVAAVGSPETGFEVIQFRLATMIDATTWRLEGLLRGQGGTGDVMAGGHAAGRALRAPQRRRSRRSRSAKRKRG